MMLIIIIHYNNLTCSSSYIFKFPLTPYKEKDININNNNNITSPSHSCYCTKEKLRIQMSMATTIATSPSSCSLAYLRVTKLICCSDLIRTLLKLSSIGRAFNLRFVLVENRFAKCQFLFLLGCFHESFS